MYLQNSNILNAFWLELPDVLIFVSIIISHVRHKKNIAAFFVYKQTTILNAKTLEMYHW
jgi:hypothetical protein